MKFIVVSVAAMLLCAFVQAQNPERCGTDAYHAQMMEDSAYAEQYRQKIEARDLFLKKNKDLSKMDCDSILYIPVAVHFQEITGIDMACAVQMSESQIETLNEDYGANNSDLNKFLDNQSDTWPGIQNGESCIRFCLATFNHPDGVGIAEGSPAVTLNEYDETDNIPDWSGYLNFFIQDMGNPLGFSPLGGNGNGDGVTIGITYFGSVSCGGNTIDGTYNLGRTVTHEVGHYFTLQHPFNGNSCAADGDGIDDTPFTDAATYGCFDPGEEIIHCDEPKLWPSYMDYCDDACLYMFSEDQIAATDAYAITSLDNLINSAKTKCEEAACNNFSAQVVTNQESCEGNDGSISINVFGAADPVQYSLNGGDTFSDNSTFQGLAEDEYEIYVVDDANCEFADTITLTREEPPMQLLSSSPAFCGDNSGSLQVEVNYDSEFQYELVGETGNQDTTFFENLVAGDYLVRATNDAGCISELEVEIPDESDLNLSTLSLKPVNCPLIDNGSIRVNVSSAAVEPVFYRLDGGLPQQEGFFNELSPGSYQISAQDERGCFETTNFTIRVSYKNISDGCPCDVFIPSAFTPDGDGLNDLVSVVPSCPITEFKIQYFDRWGELIFESDELDRRWNGSANGDGYFVPAGVYFYRMSYRWGEEFNESLEKQTEQGTISVIR